MVWCEEREGRTSRECKDGLESDWPLDAFKPQSSAPLVTELGVPRPGAGVAAGRDPVGTEGTRAQLLANKAEPEEKHRLQRAAPVPGSLLS